MKNVQSVAVKNAPTQKIIRELANYYRLEPSIDCLRHEIGLPENVAADGRVIGYDAGPGIDALIVKGSFHQATELVLKDRAIPPLTFYTVARGNLKVNQGKDGFSVGALQGTIHGGFRKKDTAIRIPREEDMLVMIIRLHRKAFFPNLDCQLLNLPTELEEVILGLAEADSNFLFQDIFHLPAVNALNDILQQENTGMLNSTFAVAKIQETLFLHLNEYKKFTANNHSRFYRREELLKSIQNAEQILVSHLQDAPTIPMLAKMAGINQQSLKQGFRQVYGLSINQYLTNKRLEHSGMLLRSGGLPIGEVAAAVGYQSAGYFSKKFKEKYGVSPKAFRQQ